MSNAPTAFPHYFSFQLPAQHLLLATLTCLLLLARPALAAPELSSSTELASAGYFQLSWQDGQGETYQLQQARRDDFSDAHTLYRGPDRASAISGLADGRYHYRVRASASSEWSAPVSVEVRHHPLSRAFGFFALGAVMFLITLVVLIKGARSQRHS